MNHAKDLNLLQRHISPFLICPKRLNNCAHTVSAVCKRQARPVETLPHHIVQSQKVGMTGNLKNANRALLDDFRSTNGAPYDSLELRPKFTSPYHPVLKGRVTRVR